MGVIAQCTFAASSSLFVLPVSLFSLAHRLAGALKMEVIAEASQRYTTRSGDAREETATMVKLSFGRHGAVAGGYYGGVVLVTLTKAMGASEIKTAVSVHALDRR